MNFDKRYGIHLLGLVSIVALGAAACSGDDSGSSSTTTSTATGTGGATATGTGGSTGMGGTISTGTGGAPAALHVYSTTNDIPDGGTYDSHDGATIPVLTSSQDPFTIENEADGDITLDDIAIAIAGDVQGEEFAYLDKDVKPAAFAATKLAKGGKFDFYLNCTPVQTGERSATVTITYSGAASGSFSYKYLCHGTQGAVFAVPPADVKASVYGGPGNSEDELFGAMVTDAMGNAYLTSTSELAQDRLNVVQVKADGTLGWSKQFKANFDLKAPDSLQNGQTGGTSGSLAIGPDGSLYLVAQASWSASNNNYYVYVAKMKSTDGSVVWEKAWGRKTKLAIASDSSNPYAIDATGTTVYVTGTTLDAAKVLVLALKADTGAVQFQKELEVVAGSNDKGFAVRYDATSKALYLGGQRSGNAGLLVKLAAADGTNPTLAWAKSVNLGTGGQVTGLELDAMGNVYAAMRVASGGTGYFIGSVDGTGKLRWSKQYAGNPSDTNDSHVVRLLDGSLWAGGRLGVPNFDSQFGDALLLKLDPATGAEQASAFYYSGKKAEQLGEHRVKGIGVANGKLVLGMQVYTATMNGVRYDGYWYKQPGMLVDGMLSLTAENGAGLADIATGIVQGPNDANGANLGVQVAAPPATFKFQPARDKHDGAPPDADMMFVSMPKL